jgi:hypothetical protein
MVQQILKMVVVGVKLTPHCFEFGFNKLSVEFTQRIQQIFLCNG